MTRWTVCLFHHRRTNQKGASGWYMALSKRLCSLFSFQGRLTCLFSSSHLPGLAGCAADDRSGSPAPGSVCTPRGTARPAAPGHAWRRAAGCRSGTGPSGWGRPGSSHWEERGIISDWCVGPTAVSSDRMNRYSLLNKQNEVHSHDLTGPVTLVSCYEVAFCDLCSCLFFHTGCDENHSRNGTVTDQLTLLQRVQHFCQQLCRNTCCSMIKKDNSIICLWIWSLKKASAEQSQRGSLRGHDATLNTEISLHLKRRADSPL